MSHLRNYGYVEGYVDTGTREIKPFDPCTTVVEEIIIVPPAGGGGGLLYVQYITTAYVTNVDGDIMTPETFSFAPLAGHVYITLNGLPIYPANGASEVATSAFYITNSAGTIVRPKGSYIITDVLRWNGSVAGYQIESDDEIKLIYQV